MGRLQSDRWELAGWTEGAAMTNFERQHLEQWLERARNPEFRDATRKLITDLVADYPDLVESGRSWPEILALAERDEELSGRHGFEVTP